MKKVIVLFGKGIWNLFRLISWIGEMNFRLLVWLFKGIFWVLGRVLGRRPKQEIQREAVIEPLPLKEMLGEYFESMEEPEPEPERPVQRVGTIVPLEEDHYLRSFTLLNSEGEIFRVDTSLPGPFYGASWTRILSCYETQETLRGRIIRTVFGKKGRCLGHQVKIAGIRAFLPSSQALHQNSHRSINVRVLVTSIDPHSQKVLLSERKAYAKLFGHREDPQEGDRVEGLLWDYDEQYLYVLLPGEYVGKAAYDGKETDIASRMGELAEFYIEELDPEEQYARVELMEDQETSKVLPQSVGMSFVDTERKEDEDV